MASFLSDLFSGGAEKEAAQKDIAALNQYQGQATGALGSAYTQGRSDLGSAISAYQPLASLGKTYSSGAPTLMGALGVGSPDEVAAAKSAFTTSPGYQFTLDQALQALQRQRAVGGMGASGNADIDAMKTATGLSDQEFQQWINNLTQTGQMGLGATGAAASGIAGGYGSLANLGAQYGQNVAGVYGNVASGDIAANNLQAAGEAAGAKNLLGAGLSLATLGLGGNPFGGSLTGGGGGSSLLGSLGTGLKNLNFGQSLFGGGSPSGYGAAA